VPGSLIQQTDKGIQILLKNTEKFFQLMTYTGKIEVGPFKLKTLNNGKEGHIIVGPLSIDYVKEELTVSYAKVFTAEFSKQKGCVVSFNSAVAASLRNAELIGSNIKATISTLYMEAVKSIVITSQYLVLNIPDITLAKCASLTIASAKMAIAVKEFALNSETVSILASKGVNIISGLNPISIAANQGVVISGKAKKSRAIPTGVIIEGETVVKLDATSIQIGGFIDPAVLGNETVQLLTQLLIALQSFSLAMGSAAVGPCLPLQAPAQTLNSQLIPLNSKLSGLLSKKVMIG